MTCLLAGLIFLAAGFVQGMTGFGSALVAIPLLALLIDIKLAVPLCVLNGLIITSFLARQLRHHLDKKRILPLLTGSLPGILAGATLLARVDATIIRHAIGCILILYGFYGLLIRPRSLALGTAWGYLAGFLTGCIGAALSAGGPPVIIYTSLTNWGKEEIKATLSGFFVINGIATAAVHALSGVTTIGVLSLLACTAPLVLLGTALGSMATGRISRERYLRVVFLLLIIMGGMMMAGN